MLMLVVVGCRDELVNITLQFPNIEKKTSWETAFAAAKQKLGSFLSFPDVLACFESFDG